MSLVIDNVESGYDRAPILHGVSMRVDPGELVAVVGSNGAGKTTMLRVSPGSKRPLHIPGISAVAMERPTVTSSATQAASSIRSRLRLLIDSA